MAIQLAYYYREIKDTDEALSWLCKAKKYLGDKNLGDLVDRDSFLSKYETTLFSVTIDWMSKYLET
jgi:hypothetical protein